MHFLKKAALLVALLGIPIASWADPISMRIAFQLNGSPEEFVGLIKEGVALQKKINPGIPNELWMPFSAGTITRSASIVVHYKNAEELVAATKREEASKEWRAFIAKFPADKFPIVYTGMNNYLYGGGDAPAPEGAVLAVFGFDLKAQAGGLAERVSRGQAIQNKLGTKSKVSVVEAFFAGDNVNSASILVQYPSMDEWARSGRILRESKEWGDFMATFPAADYQLGFSGLMVSVGVN